MHSGDLNLNPGPPYNFKLMVSAGKGMNFLHINVNSLLLKIGEIRFVAKKSEATVFGITETKQKSISKAPA